MNAPNRVTTRREFARRTAAGAERNLPIEEGAKTGMPEPGRAPTV